MRPQNGDLEYSCTPADEDAVKTKFLCGTVAVKDESEKKWGFCQSHTTYYEHGTILLQIRHLCDKFIFKYFLLVCSALNRELNVVR